MDPPCRLAIVVCHCTTRRRGDGLHRQRDPRRRAQYAHGQHPGSTPYLPMFLIMVLMVMVLVLWPELATWLPETARQAPGG